jgi:hypothetical protein
MNISARCFSERKDKALKEYESTMKIIDELDIRERDILYPLIEQAEINLDNVVKVNYVRLGAALKKIPALVVVES